MDGDPAQAKGELQSFKDSCAASDIVVVEGIHGEEAAAHVLEGAVSVPTLVTFGCALSLQSAMRLGGLSVTDNG